MTYMVFITIFDDKNKKTSTVNDIIILCLFTRWDNLYSYTGIVSKIRDVSYYYCFLYNILNPIAVVYLYYHIHIIIAD